MNAQAQTTGPGRMEHDKYTALQHARAFLRMAETDEDVARRLAEADGDMPRILAIANELSHPCTARDLAAAYDDMMRSEAAAQKEQNGAAIGAPSDPSHPIVYLTVGAPSDLTHACVYLS